MPVDSRHPEYSRRAREWEKCRDVWEGDAVVKSKGRFYLPSLTDQTDPDYSAYRGRAIVPPVFAKTVAGLTGAILRKPASIHAPKVVADLLDRLALIMGDFQGLLLWVLKEALTVGRCGVLVDLNDVTQAPTWSLYRSESILNWQEEVVDGKWQLSRVVLEEETPDPEAVDAFQPRTVTRYRELYLVPGEGYVHVRVWQRAPDGPTDLVIVKHFTPTRRGEVLRSIPFVPLSAAGVGITPPRPPLLDLADLILASYRLSADYFHGLHMVALPTPYVTGHVPVPGQPTWAIGPTVVWTLPNEKSTVGLLEFQGAGIGAIREALADLRKEMATVGTRLIEEQPRTAETLGAVRLRQSGDIASLGQIATALSVGFSEALRWTGWWLGVPAGSPVSLRLSTDYFEAGLPPQELTALVAAWQAGAISYPTLFHNLEKGELIPPSVTVEEETHLRQGDDAWTEDDDAVN